MQSYLLQVCSKLDSNSISTLSVENKYIGDAGLALIVDALTRNTSLKKLTLRNILSPSIATYTSELLVSNSNITQINLQQNNVGDEGIRTIIEALKRNCTLTRLDLEATKFGDKGAKAFAEYLVNNTTLIHLDLTFISIEDDGVTSIAESIKVNSTLTHLNLSVNSFGVIGVKSLSESLLHNQVMQYLGFSRNKIQTQGINSLIESLTSSRVHLTSLNLMDCSIGRDDGIKLLTEIILHNRSLTYLNLNNNCFGNEGVKAISDSLRNYHTSHNIIYSESSITNFRFKGNGITDLTGTEVIWKSMPKLKELNLTNNSITTIPPSFADLLHYHDNLQPVFYSCFKRLKKTIISPPSSVIDNGIIAILKYLRSANERLNTVSVFIVGYACAGKSTLREILLLPSINHGDSELLSQITRIYQVPHKPTHSVQVFRSKIGNGRDEESILQIYDFAGQTEYYSNHELFFKPLSSCYLIVISLFSADGNLKSYDMINVELKHWYCGLKHKLTTEVLHQPNRLYLCFSHFDLKSKLRGAINIKKFERLLEKINTELLNDVGIPHNCGIYYIGKEIDQLSNINTLRSSIIENINSINTGSPIYIPAIYQSIIHQFMDIHSDPRNPKSIISKSQLFDLLLSSSANNSYAFTKDDIEGTSELLHNIGDIEVISCPKYYHHNSYANNINYNQNKLESGDSILLFPRNWVVNMINHFVNSYANHNNNNNDNDTRGDPGIARFSVSELNQIFKKYWIEQITNQGGEEWSDQYLSIILQYFKLKDICFNATNQRSTSEEGVEEEYYFPAAFVHLNPHYLKEFYDSLTRDPENKVITTTRRLNMKGNNNYFQFSFFPSLQVKLCKFVQVHHTVKSYSVEIDEQWITLQSFSIKQLIATPHNKDGYEEEGNSVLIYFNTEKQYLDIYIQSNNNNNDNCGLQFLKDYYEHEQMILSGNLPSDYHNLAEYLTDPEIPLYHKILSLIFTSVDFYSVELSSICDYHRQVAVPSCNLCKKITASKLTNNEINGPKEKQLFGISFDPNLIYDLHSQNQQMKEKLQETSTLLKKYISDMNANHELFFHKFDTKEALNFLKILRIIEVYRSCILQPFVEWIAPRHYLELQSYVASCNNNNSSNIYDVSKIIKMKSKSPLPPLIQNLRIIYANNEKSLQMKNWKKFSNYDDDDEQQTSEQRKIIEWNQLLVYNLTTMVSGRLKKEKLFHPEKTDITALLQIIIHIIFPHYHHHHQQCDCILQFEVKDFKIKKLKSKKLENGDKENNNDNNMNDNNMICQKCKAICHLKDICKKIKDLRNETHHNTLSASEEMLQQLTELIRMFIDTIRYTNIYWNDELFDFKQSYNMDIIIECETSMNIIYNWSKNDFIDHIHQINSDLQSFLNDITLLLIDT